MTQAQVREVLAELAPLTVDDRGFYMADGGFCEAMVLGRSGDETTRVIVFLGSTRIADVIAQVLNETAVKVVEGDDAHMNVKMKAMNDVIEAIKAALRLKISPKTITGVASAVAHGDD